MSTRIILVRHGETDANKQKVVQGRLLNFPLNETGFQQAQKLAERLASEKIQSIYTSPQLRAYQTAEAISQYHARVPLIVRLDLAETGMGRIEGQSVLDVDKQFPDDDWDTEIFRTKVGAESFLGHLKHFERHIPSWLKPYSQKTIVISTHGGKLKTILRSLVRPEFHEWVRNEHPGNTSLTEVEWSPEKGGTLVRYNDMTHLEL